VLGKRERLYYLAVVATFCCCAVPIHAENWPAWRGPTGQGISSEENLPLQWSATENVRWKVSLPDAGNSTPVIWNEHVFVTQASEKTVWPPQGSNGGPAVARRRSLLCFRRSDGKLLWQRDILYAEKEPTHPTNPFCSASPVTDGARIVVSFGSAGIYGYDFEGKELWNKDVGKLEHLWGNASSPVLYGDLAILWCGPGQRQFLIGVDKHTGAEIWRHEEPGGSSGLGANKEWVGSWSTPILARVGDRDQLILSVPEKVKGFDPRTGTELWSCRGLSKLVYTSPLYADGVVVAMSGFHGPALAVKLGVQGDITKDRLWHHTTNQPQRIGSGVILGPHVYLVEESGAPHCFELKTGKEIWDAQVTKRPAGSCWSSLIAAGDRLCAVDTNGTTLVLAARPEYKLLATNRLQERTYASLAVSDGELFLRTDKHLWCISEKK
jgi:outer membrane protein assembly factor BamB